jgi:hypothetical protein
MLLVMARELRIATRIVSGALFREKGLTRMTDRRLFILSIAEMPLMVRFAQASP